jgi:hypothetical protein
VIEANVNQVCFADSLIDGKIVGKYTLCIRVIAAPLLTAR